MASPRVSDLLGALLKFRQRAVGAKPYLGRSRSLEDRESADETIARLNGAQLPGALLPLRIRYGEYDRLRVRGKEG